MKPPSGAGRTNTSGTIGCTSVDPKASPGLGLSWRISAIMSPQVFLAHAAELAQGRQIAPGQQIEMRDERLHRGIEAIALLELEGEAFVEIASADPGGSKPAGSPARLRPRSAGTQPLGDDGEIATEIAGLIDQIDEMLADHAPRRIGNRQHQLLGEMIGQRRLHRDEGFEVVVAVVATAGPVHPHSEPAGASPFERDVPRRIRRRGISSRSKAGSRARHDGLGGRPRP